MNNVMKAQDNFISLYENLSKEIDIYNKQLSIKNIELESKIQKKLAEWEELESERYKSLIQQQHEKIKPIMDKQTLLNVEISDLRKQLENSQIKPIKENTSENRNRILKEIIESGELQDYYNSLNSEVRRINSEISILERELSEKASNIKRLHCEKVKLINGSVSEIVNNIKKELCLHE